MPLPNLTFIKGQGGLGRPLESLDHISGLVFYCDNADLPSGFTTTTRERAIYSLEDAEDKGILGDYSDATASTATYLVTNVGANGDTIVITVDDVDPSTGESRTTELCDVEKTAAESTVTLLAVKIKEAINAGTQDHGYSADNSTGTVTITAPKSMGIALNSGTPYTATITGTIAGTLTQNVVAGVASLLAPWHYHVSEFFRMQPKGILWVGFYEIPTTYDFTEISTLQEAAEGAIRQVGIYKDDSAYANGDIALIDAICVANDDLKQPLSAVYAGDLSATADITTLTTMANQDNNKCSVVITQDGGGIGNFLWVTTGKSISNLGVLLGTIAKAKVSESIAWVEKFNISSGSECEVIKYSNGDALGSTNELTALNSKRFIFLKKHVGLSGSYWNDSHTAIAPTSDYAYIENNRTIDKAIRNLNAAYLPSLNSPIKFNSDGTITDIDVARLESVGNVALDQMVKDDELSAKSVTINPVQNVLQTSTLTIAVTLVINGVARFIEIPIGFKPSLA